MIDAKKCPAYGGSQDRAENKAENQKELSFLIIPQNRPNKNFIKSKINPPPSPIWAGLHRRARHRAALRRLGQRIQFAGRAAYDAGREALGICDDVSIFELDTNALGELARAIGELS